MNDLAPDGGEGEPMPVTLLATRWRRLDDAQLELLRCRIEGGAPSQ